MKISRVLLACSLLLSLAVPALAVDGVIEINDAKVQANGGYPFVITQSGSYRLTSNLNVPTSSNGIVTAVSAVSIDLNGFTIFGAGSGGQIGVVCSFSCSVSNGTVSGMGKNGLNLGNHGRVERVRAIGNKGIGISVGDGSVVTGSTATDNGGDGIDATAGALISGNVVYGNGGVGMWIQYGTVIGNSVSMNTSYGLTLWYGAYGNNYFSLNSGGSMLASTQVSVPSSAQLGANVCGIQPCP
jgi:hypothetical protein